MAPTTKGGLAVPEQTRTLREVRCVAVVAVSCFHSGMRNLARGEQGVDVSVAACAEISGIGLEQHRAIRTMRVVAITTCFLLEGDVNRGGSIRSFLPVQTLMTLAAKFGRRRSQDRACCSRMAVVTEATIPPRSGLVRMLPFSKLFEFLMTPLAKNRRLLPQGAAGARRMAIAARSFQIGSMSARHEQSRTGTTVWLVAAQAGTFFPAFSSVLGSKGVDAASVA